MRKKLHTILVTGAAGFIGSEFVRQKAKDKSVSIVAVDKVTYAGDVKRLQAVKNQFKFFKVDIANRPQLERIFKAHQPQTVIHFAAETHVDRSIHDVRPFINTNVNGTQNLIDLVRKYKTGKMIHISTDEVYGDSHKGWFKETDPIRANNPYSATKAAAEHLIRAAIRTFQFPAIIIRPSNNYGYWQYPEKLIPVVILKALNNESVPVYGKGKQIREWLHVSDCANAVNTVLNKGQLGETYNIGTYFEQTNIKTVEMILKKMNKPKSLIKFVPDRPGHDFRYSVDCKKLEKLGWKAKVDFNTGLDHTVDWFLGNLPWVEQKRKILQSFWKKVYKA